MTRMADATTMALPIAVPGRPSASATGRGPCLSHRRVQDEAMKTALDPRLIRRAQDGKREAVAQVLEACRPLYERALRKRGLTGDAAEDVLQEALAVVVQQLPGFEGRSTFETWALAVLFRVQLRHRERATLRGQRQSLESEVGDEEDEGILERAEGRLGDPAREAERDALRVALAECAGRVPIEMREVWLRHRLRGQEHHVIATTLSLSINTVGTRIYRADRKLRDCMEAKGFTPETVGVR